MQTKEIKHYKDSEKAIEAVKKYVSQFELIHERKPCGAVMTFGCQQNEADSERMRGVLSDLGYDIVAEPEDADIILVNTCAVREHAEKKVLSVIGTYKHLKKEKPHLMIGVCGCMSAQESRREELKRSYPYVDFATGPAAAHRLPSLIAERLRGGKRNFAYIAEDDICEQVPTVRDKSYAAWVNIMHGCNNFCTYCIVPYVRGRERSRHREDILAECERLISEGVKEITLLGQNVNSYGRGLYEDYDFSDLLRDVCSLDGDFTVRFMTSHPKDATEKLFRTIAQCPKAARHFHLPLQSGSTRILKEMNRKYTFEAYYEKIKKLRELVPDIAITSDIIVAFPGETEEDFQKTLDAVAIVGYDMLYSFIYSPRKGTPAAEYEGQIPKEISSERFARLLEVQNAEARKRNEPYVGRTVRVLCEGESKTDSTVCAGKTSSGKIVFFPEKKNAGDLVNVKIERCDAYSLYGNAEN